jgi:hypothetical protein
VTVLQYLSRLTRGRRTYIICCTAIIAATVALIYKAIATTEYVMIVLAALGGMTSAAKVNRIDKKLSAGAASNARVEKKLDEK